MNQRQSVSDCDSVSVSVIQRKPLCIRVIRSETMRVLVGQSESECVSVVQKQCSHTQCVFIGAYICADLFKGLLTGSFRDLSLEISLFRHNGFCEEYVQRVFFGCKHYRSKYC